jgi:hypothetical protein
MSQQLSDKTSKRSQKRIKNKKRMNRQSQPKKLVPSEEPVFLWRKL